MPDREPLVGDALIEELLSQYRFWRTEASKHRRNSLPYARCFARSEAYYDAAEMASGRRYPDKDLEQK